MMAAGQKKKRLAGSNLQEHYRGKKKKNSESADYVLNFRSCIQLEWDDNEKRAMAKREQIGVTWMDMSRFVDSAPRSSGLADVFSVPQEIFDLDNLMGVLSYEVWANNLSESERKLLTQFLPSGIVVEQAVQLLLTGENHHFGNPFLKWSTSLCSGGLHPDNVLRIERQCRVDKNAYYTELNKYHNDMLEVLKQMKERWGNSKAPEKLWRKGMTKSKQESESVSTDRSKMASISKKEIPHEICIGEGNSSKYISYIKINKKQLHFLNSLKQSGDGILPKSLNCVLGDIKGYVVEPYEAFEEEKKRFRYHWLRVANQDISVAFDDWRDRKLLRENWSKSLKRELSEENKILMDEPEERSKLRAVENGVSGHHSTLGMRKQEESDSQLKSTQNRDLKLIPGSNRHQELSSTVLNQGELGQAPVKAAESPEDLPQLVESRNLERVIEMEDQEALGQDLSEPGESSPFSQFAGKATEDVVKNGEDPLFKHMLKPQEVSPVLPQFVGNRNSIEDAIEWIPIIPSDKMWQSVSTRDSYYQTNRENHGHPSVGASSLRQTWPGEKHPAKVIDLENNIVERKTGGSDSSSLFRSYAKQKHSELLPSLRGGSHMLPLYPLEHSNGLKQPGLQLLMANKNFSSSEGLSPQFQEQQQFVEQRQAREKELYLQQIMNKNVYSNSRYSVQRHFSLHSPQGLSTLPSVLNGGLGSHNWYADDRCAPNGWPGLESASQSLADGGAADGSLFSVLSECRKLPSRFSYDEARSSEQFMQVRHPVSSGISTNENIYGYASRQLNSSTSNDTAVRPASALNNSSWMTFRHQNQQSWNR